MATTEQVLIAGGGIAGPTLALALDRAGIRSTIYEAFDHPADHVGSFLNVASNGMAALGVLGLTETVAAAGITTPTMRFLSTTGKHLGDVANGTPPTQGTPSTTIRRGDLNRILREAAIARGIPVISGKRLVAADVTTSQVNADFTDGTTAAGDLLVGADGIHSTVRSLVDARNPTEPRYCGLLSIGGHTRGVPVDAAPGVFHMMFGREGFFSYLVTEAGEVWWFANVPEPTEPHRGELASVTSSTWRERLVRLFAADRGPARDLIESADEPLGAYPLHDLPTVPTWSRDRMAVLGDAAHATSPSAGQGASMAIESAIVLAKGLRDAPRLSGALSAYEALRRPRVERVVAYSAKLSGSKTAGPVGRRLRDVVMPIALKYGASPQRQAWLYGHAIPWEPPVATSLTASCRPHRRHPS